MANFIYADSRFNIMAKPGGFLTVTFIIMLLLISGCKGNSDAQEQLENLRSGTLGLTASFLPNNPPATIHVEENEDNKFDIVLEVSNKGVYPQPEDGIKLNGRLYLSGYDKDIIEILTPSIELSTLAIDGKSSINLNGGSDLAVFKASIDHSKLPVEKYEPTLLATACYNYITVAGPSVCIDPDPYATIKQKKVCEAGSITLSGQGAPVAVVRVDTEAFASKTQFKITIKNAGNGEVLKSQQDQSMLQKCDPFGSSRIGREDINKVYLEEVSLGNIGLDCWPFAEEQVKAASGHVRLLNGEGSIICEIGEDSYASTNAAYTSPLRIKLSYGYKINAERKISVKKEGLQN